MVVHQHDSNTLLFFHFFHCQINSQTVRCHLPIRVIRKQRLDLGAFHSPDNGTCRLISVPSSGAVRTFSSPFNSTARSRMPTRPNPPSLACGLVGSKPRP